MIILPFKTLKISLYTCPIAVNKTAIYKMGKYKMT